MWLPVLFITGLLLTLDLGAQVPASSTNSGDFFEFLSINDLTSEEKAIIGLPNESSGTSYDYIRFNNQQSNAENGYYTVEVPLGIDLSPSWIKVTYANQGANHVGIRGEGQYGDFAVYFVENEGASGYGYTNTKRFSLAPIDESFSVVTYENIPPIDAQTAQIDAVAMNTPAEATEQSTIECAATIDVLFLRTEAVDDILNARIPFPKSFNAMVPAICDHTNETLLNSKVGPKQIRAIIHPTPVAQIQYSDPGGPGLGPCYGAMSVLKADQSIKILRQFYDADMVVYYDDQLASCGGIAGGFGVTYDDAYVLNNIYSEVEWFNYLINNTHELGHNFGGYHSKSHELTEGPWPHFTMMETGVDKGAKVPHYSNPDADYTHPDNGETEVTGTVVDDNSKFVIQNFCRQADMETSGDFLAHISAQQYSPKQPCDEIRFFGRADAGNTGGPNSGPYSYEWRVSTSGYYPTSPSSIFSTLQNPIWITPNVNQVYYIFLNVTSATGVTTRVMRTVSSRCALGPPDLQFFRVSNKTNDHDLRYAYSHEVTVNSSSTSILKSLGFESNTSFTTEDVVVKLYNSSGQFVAKSTPTNLDVRSDLTVPGNVPSGIYHLVLERLDGSILKSSRIPLVK